MFKGTIIRLFNVNTKQKLAELRRGNNSASIYAISFSIDSRFLSTVSDKVIQHLLYSHYIILYSHYIILYSHYII